MTIKRITIDSIFLALLIVSAYISIPISGISLTIQVLVVLLLALILPYVDSQLIIFIYILMGLIGIPVFSNFTSGFSKIFTPSFGFLLAFLFVPLIIKLLNKINIKKVFVKNLIICFIALIIIYIVAVLYLFILSQFYQIDVMNFIVFSLLPLIPFDIIKVIIVCSIKEKLKEGLFL